jgi:hypothetical protein
MPNLFTTERIQSGGQVVDLPREPFQSFIGKPIAAKITGGIHPAIHHFGLANVLANLKKEAEA